MIALSSMVISTHTPLAGRDDVWAVFEQIGGISTHTPLAGRDILNNDRLDAAYQFLLTRPLRDVTLHVVFRLPVLDFYSHAPCGT